jgi:XRE family aerobic/anaerobic benzoate catabolism transcriptional regulator
MNHLRQQIGKRLKARRNSLKLSLKECAEQSQLSARYLIQAEAGEANLSINKLAQLCQTLDIRLAELLSDGTRGKIDTILSRLSPHELEEAYQILTAHFGRSHHSMIALLGLRGAGKSSVGQALA